MGDIDVEQLTEDIYDRMLIKMENLYNQIYNLYDQIYAESIFITRQLPNNFLENNMAIIITTKYSINSFLNVNVNLRTGMLISECLKIMNLENNFGIPYRELMSDKYQMLYGYNNRFQDFSNQLLELENLMI